MPSGLFRNAVFAFEGRMPSLMSPMVALLIGLSTLCPLSRGDDGRGATIPILLDTDIGGEFDDALALGLVLASPELELRGVTTVHGDAFTRAMIVCRFLFALGREEIPVAAGAPPRAKPDLEGPMQYGLRAAQKRPVKESASEFLYEKLKADPGQVTLIAIGPLTNVAELFEKHPDAVKLVKRVVLMGGSFKIGYNGKPPAEPEYNVKSDVTAAKKVFTSGAPLVVVPLDATATLTLEKQQLEQILAAETSAARNLNSLHRLWNKNESVVLFDPAAVFAATIVDDLIDESTATDSHSLPVNVDEDGRTIHGDGKVNAVVVHRLAHAEQLSQWTAQRLALPSLPSATWPEIAQIRLRRGGSVELLGNRLTIDGLREILKRAAQAKTPPRNVAIRPDFDVPTVELIRLSDACTKAGLHEFTFDTAGNSPSNVARVIDRGPFPRRFHVIENYETDIERRWWLSGKIEEKDVPPGSRRACRAVLCNDFDDLQGDRWAMYQAVIFNPVPGPPMGKHTRLAFRYKLSGTDALRVQIYSLSNGHHRHLTLTDLKQDEWQEAAIDMTDARRPDGSGGPLAEDERIDDIQFYTDAKAELLIDDIILYDAADEGSTGSDKERPFPARPIFTGWFDTGEQGQEWPGRFEIVPHEKPLTWDAARAVKTADGKHKEVYLDLRGPRPLGETTKLRFRHRLSGADAIQVTLVGDGESQNWHQTIAAAGDSWSEGQATFEIGRPPAFAVGLLFQVPAEAQLLVDDVLVYE